ncbi:MAG: hypothetical protein MJ106_06250, partial [Lentisphaeria bacterium]|nr:hypothetical protein [Lentisphaeria bacterium]
MKELTDLSIFNREESTFLYRAGRTVVWENRSAMQYEYYGVSYDPSLSVSLLVNSLCTKQIYYQHRIHLLPVTFDFVVSGSTYFRSGKKAILAEAGDIVILPQDGDNAILYLPSLGPCERYGMIIEGALFTTLLKFYNLEGFMSISIANPQV